MACIYDADVFNKFRALAVTDINDLIVGQRYYSNTNPAEFVIQKLGTAADMWYDVIGRPLGAVPPAYDNTKIAWFMYAPKRWCSLRDRNVLASYNPWLIFKDAETAQRCRDELHVEIEADW